jgi:hypothetical protein
MVLDSACWCSLDNFFESTSEKAETLDLEVLNDALSFATKKYRGQKF